MQTGRNLRPARRIAARRWTFYSTASSKGRTPTIFKKEAQTQSVLTDLPPAKSIVKLAIPATLALLAKAVYNPVASFAFGAKDENRFHQSVRFALKGSLLLTVLVAAAYISLSKPLILLFNRNSVIVEYGKCLPISQVALYPAFGLCYMMTITYQTIGASRYGLILSLIRQGLFFIPFILTLPRFFGVTGIYLSQPAADVLTILVCLGSIKSMKATASRNMASVQSGST